jgi:hypothetical protein
MFYGTAHGCLLLLTIQRELLRVASRSGPPNPPTMLALPILFPSFLHKQPRLLVSDPASRLLVFFR